MHWSRQYAVFLRRQDTRHYTPSSRGLASNSLPNSKRSKDAHLPAKFPNHRPYAPRVFRAPQADGPRQQPSPKFKWLVWAKSNKFIFFCLCIYGYTISMFPRDLQRVPITERRQLLYLPCWLEDNEDHVDRKMEETINTQNSSLGSESPSLQRIASIFSILVHVSGLNDRGWHQWELRIIDAPGQ